RLGDQIGAQPSDVAAAVAHRPHRIDQTHDRLAGRGTADTVAPQQRHDLALADREVNTLQDVALAVEGMQVTDLEHHAAIAPRYASCTARLERISVGGPDAITLP